MFEHISTAEMVTAVKAKKKLRETETDTCVVRAYSVVPTVAPSAPGMERR